MSPNTPSPSQLVHLRPSDRRGLLFAGEVAALTIVALSLSRSPFLPLWLIGQAALALAFLQWFVILHECGHETLFRSRRLNSVAGTIAGLLSLIPFRTWRRIHGRHHKWTGWQDLDPTTETLVPRPRTTVERSIVNVCWRLWIPLFSIGYRVQNFWHLRRVLGMFPRETDRRAIRIDTFATVAVYLTILIALGPERLVHLVGLALLLSLIVEDLLLLSQHTHIPQHVSHGEEVRPYPAVEQAAFTRSLRLPAWLSALLLHFDAHELHHMFPFVPGYHLHRIGYAPPNEIGWWQWVTVAKRVPADVLLYENRAQTGLEV